MSGRELDTIGVILMLVGIVWLGLSLWPFYSRRRGTVVTQRRMSDPTTVSGGRPYVEEHRIHDEPPDPY